MNKPAFLPENYERLQTVDSLTALFNAQLGPVVNAIRFPRDLTGDFNALAFSLDLYNKTHAYKPAEIERQKIAMSREAAEAADIVLADMRMVRDYLALTENDPAVSLRMVRKSTFGIYEFHEDGANGPAGRILCCYNDPVTEWVVNEDADKGFGQYSNYKMRKGAPVYRFKAGDIWRHAGTGGNDNVLPFIHRSPQDGPKKGPPRLLLVSG